MKTWETPDMVTLDVNKTARGGYDRTRFDDYVPNQNGQQGEIFFPSANGEGRPLSELPED